ncbi:hypothetical protein N7466_008332 [Penicillium verhagenii]|uniref:uncharacterized protein n=1 Tax=Penicillium verhagenii TaxID=1562060 RepID=UPI0025452468|nr:uncharacterized protein N7466_008332 [Penicillium verhagenii]KAJ5924145.1 hypothetical protein N7466_008332 [Penicillium verhagenii]
MKASSLSLSAGSLFLLSLASTGVASEYELVETWQGQEFFDYFHFYTGADPTNGWVTYLDQASAESSGLVKVTDRGTVYIGVDHQTTLSTTGKGRDSVRVGTNKYYEHSLVVADIAHMPGSVCGSWPAFWTVGKVWPQDGEIDIIEGVNLQNHNEIVMHTGGTCALTDQGMSGIVNATGCGEALGTVGCVIEGHEGSYGDSFNNQGGGIYAMEWTEEFLKIWFFPRHSIPPSLSSGEPDVTEFGIPMALVQEGCDVANSFKEQSFVFDVTFCGDWAGGVFGESGCPMTNPDSFQSCTNYVAQNPDKFKDTYWEINSVKVYQTEAKNAAPAQHGSLTHAASQAPVTHTLATKTATETHVVPQVHSSASVASHSTEEATHVVESATHASVSPTVHPAGGAPHSVESASHATEIFLTVTPVAVTSPMFAASKIPTSLLEEQSPVPTTHAKPAVTRYVTEFVTGTTTLCASAETETSSNLPSANIAVSSHASHATHAPQAPDVTPTSPSYEIETPAGWAALTKGSDGHFTTSNSHTSSGHSSTPSQVPQIQSTPAREPSGADAKTTSPPHAHSSHSSTPSKTPQVQSPHAQAPSGADAVSIKPASHRPPPNLATPSSLPHKPSTGPARESGAVKPSSTPHSSKAVIPKPSGGSAASTSSRHVFPGLSPSATSPVFTGAAERLPIQYPVMAAALGLALVV